MSRTGALLTVVLAIASIGVLAQDTSQHAPAPAANTQGTSVSPASAQTQNSGGGSPQTTPAAQEAQTQSASRASNDSGETRQLPQTSTILPLLGLIGLGSLVAGLFARR